MTGIEEGAERQTGRGDRCRGRAFSHFQPYLTPFKVDPEIHVWQNYVSLK
ncbi:hypothetical protein SAZ11_57030 [Streptomyces sp. FXJ1.4098]|nr:hypothetical protein [Streptomyces sp. FXJ1.4098]